VTRRAFAFLVAAPVALGVPAASAAAAPGDPLAELLASSDLERSNHPVAAEFYFAEGQKRFTEAERAEVKEQLVTALGRQTSFIGMMAQGMAGMANSDSMKQMQEWQKKNSMGSMMVKGALGLGPAPPQIDNNKMQSDMQQAMVDPWVRGIGAAEALVAAGKTNTAATFYLSCLQMLEADWVPSACLDGILGLGPRKAEKLLTWMLENAEGASMTNTANWAGAEAPKPDKKALPDRGMVQLRNAALEGLGALVGGGALEPASRDRAMASLLAYSQGKENELYARGVAAGLGRSRDPRALEPLRKIAKRRGDPDAKQSALQGLAMGFRDEAAIKQLRGELDDRDPEEQLRAAQALYELGDEAAFRWAVEVIGQRRSTDTKKADIRALVVRDLVELGGVPARQALEQALAAGPGNDWLVAWVEVALLELGDVSKLDEVEAAMARTDWKLDPRGFRSIWRAIAPFVKAALQVALTGGLGLASPSTLDMVKQGVQLVGNFAAGERQRSLAKKSKLEGAIAQMRWQSADALGATATERSGAILQRLLADEDSAVRLSAAVALARLNRPEALDGLATAFALDFGSEDGVPRTGAVRAALLRAALLRFPTEAKTAAMVTQAKSDPDGAVRFIALAGLRPAA
jgi:HEAT repeat protein